MAQTLSVKELSKEQQEKILKFGKRNYDLCGHSLRKLVNFDKAVYDSKIDMFFENYKARVEYLQEYKAPKKKKEKTCSLD